jgi:hypothetical protein
MVKSSRSARCRRPAREQQEMHRTIDLDAMLAIERRTGKR